jgi:hypothetical protein
MVGWMQSANLSRRWDRSNPDGGRSLLSQKASHSNGARAIKDRFHRGTDAAAKHVPGRLSVGLSRTNRRRRSSAAIAFRGAL